jgi:hypothetical protein
VKTTVADVVERNECRCGVRGRKVTYQGRKYIVDASGWDAGGSLLLWLTPRRRTKNTPRLRKVPANEVFVQRGWKTRCASVLPALLFGGGRP